VKAHVSLSTAIVRSARVQQVEGIFALPPSQRSDTIRDVELPLDARPWSIGLIVGPSGSGKTSIARELFPDALVTSYAWPLDRSVLDAFPHGLSIKTITELLSCVGFSSPPSWLRPFHALSNGEQFRVTIARALAEQEQLVVIDEFTSVVDRTVAKATSAAAARAVRSRKGQRFIALSCHYDIVEWLDPDWIYQPHLNAFDWRSLQGHPPVDLRVFRVDSQAWQLFRATHYLDTTLNRAAGCFVAYWHDVPVAFLAVLSFPHAHRPGWRFHRLVCLPDYQGLGIGVALGDFIAACYKATGKPVFRTLAHPAVIRHCAKSPVWTMVRAPSRTSKLGSSSRVGIVPATSRITAGFEYVGPSNPDAARGFGLIR
jgi:GNAT superfamily N-acetyltransferase